MRKSILSLASLMMLSATVSAQQVEGEVTMGAGYANNVFYNLETQDEHAVSKDIWDLAFYRNNAMDTGIKINEAKGGLYMKPVRLLITQLLTLLMQPVGHNFLTLQ